MMNKATVAKPNLKLEAVNGPHACNVYLEARKEAPHRIFARIASINPGLKFKLDMEESVEVKALPEL
jgi:hypothetical protein